MDGYENLVKRIADFETRIVKTIYDLADAENERMTHIERSKAALNNRFSAMEQRILDIELRINTPPAA